MQKKIEEHIFQGMQRDVSISKQKPEYLWDANNIRLTSRHGDTLLSMTNERGTKEISLSDNQQFQGVVLGYCMLGQYLTVFTTVVSGNSYIEKPDYIYRLQKIENGFDMKILYNGNLNFSVNCPIECLGVYENEVIQKVYWTDGLNQPRLINIVKTETIPQDEVDKIYNDNSFDFIPTLDLKDTIHVEKVADSSGLFAAGVIQYAVTYYNKYGQESNISVVSPLIPTSFTSRAGSPEETIGNAFKVTIKNPDAHFEYLRLYSIFRSSKNTTPVCKRVADVRLGYGGDTLARLYISKDKRSRAYARFATGDNYGIFIKKNYSDLQFTNLSEAGIPLCNEDYITPDTRINFKSGKYYHITKQDYPELIIKAYVCSEKPQPRWMNLTWDTCTDIYISAEGNIPGPGVSSYPIIVGTGGSRPLMTIANQIYFTYEEFIGDGITITDNGTIGEDVDYNELLFVGGEEITAGTITQKDGTLFLGDIRISRPRIEGKYPTSANDVYAGDVNMIDEIINGAKDNVTCTHRKCWFPLTMHSSSYQWGNTLDAHNVIEGNPDTLTEYSTNIAGFKWGEHYRLGLQFQYKTGKWSQPVFIGDYTMGINNNNPSEAQGQRPSFNALIDDEKCLQNIPTFNVKLSSGVGKMMLDNNYKRVRAVVCFPTESDQLILCQGVVNPTVHSIAGRLNHTPDIQSSWYFRPVPAGDESQKIGWNEGGIPQHKHGYTLYSGTSGVEDIDGVNQWLVRANRDCEIQGAPIELGNINAQQNDLYNLSSALKKSINVNNYVQYTDESNNNLNSDLVFDITDSRSLTNTFVVDWNYLTFHSPEFEFNDAFRNMDTSTLSCRITGRHMLTTNYGDLHIITSSTPIGTDAPGFYHRAVSSSLSACRINAGLFYRDNAITLEGTRYVPQQVTHIEGGNIIPDDEVIYSFLVYPWHRTGSLNNDCVRPVEIEGSRTAVLSQKKMVNLMCFNDVSNSPNEELYIEKTINEESVTYNSIIKVFNSDQVALVKINDKNYFGNIDQVLNSPVKYPIASCASETFTAEIGCLPTTSWSKTNTKEKGLYLSNDPVYMKYKSTPHAIIYTTVTPTSRVNDSYTYAPQSLRFLNNGNVTYWPYLYRVEMYRDPLPTDFGGSSTTAIQSNMWYPAGPAIQIGHNENETPLDAGGNVIDDTHTLEEGQVGMTSIPFWYGDTYFQRYDCLKTYPFTDEDTNSIIEIGSFLVETRINMDGRYDKNRGNTSNFMLNPTNFNLINPVYSQMDNFFNYRILDEDYYNLSNYPTMVTWTGYKNNAAEVDSWTNITLSSTLEMDGTKGKVNAVRVNSDQLYCFQDDALGQILFNSRVQISPSDGVPIEISNNYKVDGNRYISTTIGCKNKWSIIESIDGLYFIDDNTKALYLLGGQSQLKPISTPLNMSYWFMNQDTATPWLQHYYDGTYRFEQQGIRCFYDNVNADLYICTPEKTLCYSEKLGQFVSFYDYHNVMGMFNMDSEYYALNYPDIDDRLSIVKLWGMFQGKYNTFFSKTYQTDFTFISNENPLNDKIFSNIELRGDFRYWPDNEPQPNFDSSDHEIDHRKMFDTVRVWNEYQDTGDVDLEFINDTPSNMKKKFRIWRMDIPRDKDHFRQRIRNTWTKVKFTMNNPNHDDAPYNPGTGPQQAPAYNSPKLYDMEIHDIGVVYFV